MLSFSFDKGTETQNDKVTSIKWQSQDLLNVPLFSVYLIIGAVSSAGLLSANPAYSTNRLTPSPASPPGPLLLLFRSSVRTPFPLPCEATKIPLAPNPQGSLVHTLFCFSVLAAPPLSWHLLTFSPQTSLAWTVAGCLVLGLQMAV